MPCSYEKMPVYNCLTCVLTVRISPSKIVLKKEERGKGRGGGGLTGAYEVPGPGRTFKYEAKMMEKKKEEEEEKKEEKVPEKKKQQVESRFFSRHTFIKSIDGGNGL